MQTVIIFPNDLGGISLCQPTDCGLPISEIARKDVPSGKPFLLVSKNNLPDCFFIEAFEADFSTPDGYGIGSQNWFIEQYEKELAETTNPWRIKELNDMIAVQRAELIV